MKFDLSAAKAYVGGLFSGGFGAWLAGLIIGLSEAGLHIDIPANIEDGIKWAVAAVVGWLAVYFTPNKQT